MWDILTRQRPLVCVKHTKRAKHSFLKKKPSSNTYKNSIKTKIVVQYRFGLIGCFIVYLVQHKQNVAEGSQLSTS